MKAEGDTRPFPWYRHPSGPVWILNGILAIIAGILFYEIRDLSRPIGGPNPVLALGLALAFGAAEIWVIHIQFRKDAHTISLSEIPLTVSLFVLSPPVLIIALVVGVLPALTFHRRQALLKLTFNVLQFVVSAEVAALVFHSGILSLDPAAPASWLMALMATWAASIVGMFLVSAVIALSEGHVSLPRRAPVMAFSLAGTTVNTGLALVGVVTTYRNPVAGILLVLPTMALYGAYLAYNRERQKTERIEFLYNSGRTLATAAEGEAGIVKLLRESLGMFRAERAQVSVWSGPEEKTISTTTVQDGDVLEFERPQPVSGEDRLLEEVMASDNGLVLSRGDANPASRAFLEARGLRDAVVTSLRAENRVVGTILVGNYLGDVAGFNQEHLNLLETLAVQVGAAVENTRLERVLHHQAFHDALTNLPNRALLNQRVDAALARSAKLAVLLIDVDDFKVVNDTMGHTIGDQLLVGVADRLTRAIRGTDAAARIGGDEFAVLVEDITSIADATAAAGRIVDALRPVFPLAGREVAVNASIGIATNLEGLIDPGALMLQADVAMYAAKADHRGGFRLFEASMQDEVAERHALREDLRRALERHELVNHYQPLLALEDNRVVGMEALVRWPHRDRGMIAPGFFIRIAEESGLIVQLGRWVLEQACRQLRDWQRAYPALDPLTVSVNLSAVQLRHPGFVDDVVVILKETGLDPRSLTLEITESTFMDDTRTAIARLRELRGLGIRLELDDFGTGYSSLSVLRDLPLDGLKIDKSFVDGIGAAADRPAFLQAIVRLAEALDLEMVGEGIEHPHQADALRAMGCTRGQGYHFSRPLPASDMATYLSASAEWARAADSPVVRLPARRRTD